MSKKQGLHENYDKKDDVTVGSERSFGQVFAVVFAIIGLFPLLGNGNPRIWALVVSAAFLIVALTLPKLLKHLNILWFKIGLLLHKVVTPVIMGLMFYFVVTPVAMAMRIFGKRPLDLSFDKDASTYWIDRDRQGDAREDMKRQF